MMFSMIACSLALSASPASLVMKEGERRRLDEPPLLFSACDGALSKIDELKSSCGSTDDDAQVPLTPTTCASDACTNFIANMNNATLQEIMSGLATCTGQQAHDSQGVTEDYLKIGVLTTASECNLTSPLSPGPLDTCPGAVIKLGEMFFSCGSNEEDAHVPRTDTTCASDACASFIASVTDAALQNMTSGVGKCTGMTALFTASLTEDVLKRAVLGTASECGLTSPLSPFPLYTCLGASTKINEIPSSCGDNEGDAGVPRTNTTCASDACAGVIANVTDAALQAIMNGLTTCTGEQAEAFQNITEDYLKFSVLKTASECGLTSPLSPFPLDTCPGAITKFNEVSSACGSTYEDAQVPRTDTTCASDACAGVIANVTDAALQDIMNGLTTCTGEQAEAFQNITEDYLKFSVLKTASECNLTSPLSPFPLDTCPGAMTKYNEMSSSCGETGDNASVPRTDETCASDACAGAVSSMTHDVVQRMSTGASKCTGEFMAFQAFQAASFLTFVVRTTAHECGLTSPLISDVCSTANEGWPCGSIYSGKTCQCTGRRRARNLLFGTLPGASCRCA